MVLIKPSVPYQRGTALLTVLFILVLLSTLAVYTTEDENIAIRRAQNQRDAEQSHQVALAGEQWVSNALRRDLLSAPQGLDYFGDEWALLQSQVVSVEDGEMAVQAVDEGGKFNLNNLSQGKMIQDPATTTPKLVISPWYSFFTRLLVNVGLEEELAEAAVDWVDTNDEPTGSFGAEDSVYASADPPYLAANQPFSIIAELAQVAGFGKVELEALAPYIAALPVDPDDPKFSKINMYTASQVVLQSMDDAISSVNIDGWLQQRANPGANVNQIFRILSPSIAFDEFEALATIKSDYFSAQSCAKFGRVNYAQQSLLYRDEQAQEVTVLSRQRRYNCGITKP